MNPANDLPEEEWLALVREALSIGDAPPSSVRGALELWRTHGPRRHAPDAPRRWVAVLSSDTWAVAPQALGLRALPSDVRHMLFAADERDVDVRIAPQAEGFAVSGQHLGPDAGGSVELSWVAGGKPVPAPLGSALNDMGEFRFDGVEPGTYLLTLRIGSDEIVLPPFDVGSPAAGPGT